MPYNPAFDIKLEIGEAAEDSFLRLAIGRNVTVEVKHDIKASETGNVFIEYAQRGRPSGIATTEADYWAICIDGQWALIETKKLRNFARLIWKTMPQRRKHGGDNQNQGVLIRVRELLQLKPETN